MGGGVTKSFPQAPLHIEHVLKWGEGAVACSGKALPEGLEVEVNVAAGCQEVIEGPVLSCV